MSAPWRLSSLRRMRVPLLSSIRGRILAFFVTLIVGLTLIAIGTVWIARQYQHTTDSQHEHARVASLLNNVARDGAAGAVYMQFYLSTGDEELLGLSQQRLSASAAALDDVSQQLRADGREQDAARIEALIAESEGIATAWAQATVLGLAGNLDAAEAVIAESLNSVQILADELLSLAENEQDAIDAISADAETVTRTAVLMTVAAGGFVIIAAAAAFWVLGRSIVRPLEKLEASARALGEGDLTARAPVRGPSELAAVGEAFNQMTEALLEAARRRALEAEREATFAALRESEDKWRRMIRNAQDIITVMSEDGTIQYVSPAVERILGLTPEDLTGSPALDLVHPEDRELVARQIAEVFSTKAPATAEFRFRHKDGTWRHLESIGIMMEGGDGPRMIVNSRDLTERRETAARLEFQSSLLSAVADAVIAIGLDTRILYWNVAAERLFGWSAGEARRKLFAEVVGMRDEAAAKDVLARVATGESFTAEFEIKVRSGEWIPVEVSVSPLRDGSGRIIGAIGDAHDISERKAAEEMIRHMAYHDALTGLPNRLLLKDRFAMAIAQSRRVDSIVGVLSLDLDRFKIINDTLGHSRGDEILAMASQRLTAAVREQDTVARLGGDEFMILLVSLESKDEGIDAAARIVDEFRLPFVIDGASYHTTASVGVAFYGDDGDDLESIVAAADAAMYAAKSAGRDNFRTYDAELLSGGAETLALEADLRRALQDEQLDVHYQPQVSVQTGAIIGVEALARWYHPTRGPIAPAQFIPLAEETGLIVTLGRQILRRACTDAVSWEKDGGRPVRLAVNSSIREFTHPDFVRHLAQILHDTGFPAARLQIEITETEALDDINVTKMVAGELSELGVTLAIDDFGAGSTSLRYLSELPLRTLKIDGGFIQDTTEKPRNSAIAASVVALAQKLSLEVIAEGVESAAQLRFLEEHNCDAFQGFLYASPQPADKTRELLISAAAAVG